METLDFDLHNQHCHDALIKTNNNLSEGHDGDALVEIDDNLVEGIELQDTPLLQYQATNLLIIFSRKQNIQLQTMFILKDYQIHLRHLYISCPLTRFLVQAIKEKMKALEDNKTWNLILLLREKKIILVVKVYIQTYGVDYQETFSLVAKPSTIMVLFSLATNLD
ncbi:hypothetical protein CR513_51168, partial [Mucuna pruriens]